MPTDNAALPLLLAGFRARKIFRLVASGKMSYNSFKNYTPGSPSPRFNIMASETDRRIADFEEVKAVFAEHPNIKVVQVEGEPPDAYQIEYQLPGLVRNPDGTVRKASQHTVLFSLPFGYPHFPPAVKPLTPIFHPDIDPDAVRIAAHWQQQPTLADLIAHVGEMISGSSYSLEDPFNQEAADWYSEHAAELPLDGGMAAAAPDGGLDLGLELDLGALSNLDEQGEDSFGLQLDMEPPHQATPAFDLGLEEKEEQAAPPAQEDDGLDLGLAIEMEEPPPPPQVDLKPKLDELRAHVGRKEMTIAARMLGELPSSGPPELEALRRTVGSALKERDKLLQELKVLEDEENFPAAEEVLKKVKKIAVDTPGLAEIGRRLQESKAMLDTFAGKKEAAAAQEEPPPPPAEGEEPKKKPAKKKEPPPPPKKEERKQASPSGGRARLVRKQGLSLPSTPFLVALGLAVMILGGGMLYTRDADKLREARSIWREAGYLVKQQRFDEAKLKIDNAVDALDSMWLPGLGQSGLEDEMQALLDSEEFKMGVDGKGSYKGQLLPLPEVGRRKELDRLTELAERLAKDDKTKEAALAYEEAWRHAAKNGFTAEAPALEKRAHELSMKDALHVLGNEFDQSMKDALKAFERELEQSQQGFTDAQWQKVAELLERAILLLEQNPAKASPEKQQELKHLLARARLYQFLAAARQFYDSKNFAAAVNTYRQALQLLNDHQSVFGTTYSDSAEKIRGIIVDIEINGGRRAAADAEQRKDFPAAIECYKKLFGLLAAAGAAPQELDSVKEKIRRLETTSDMLRKKEWLNRNFEQIFRKAYPQSPSSSILSKPTMTFDRVVNGLEVYRLRCDERSQGLSATLEVKYAHNPATGQWSPYAGQ